MPSDDKLGPYRVLFEVRVVESFRGPEKTGEIVDVRTGFGGGDCGYRFNLGAKYLIDASRKDQMLLTNICSLTAPLEDSEVELRTLRRIAVGQRPPDLVGILMRGTPTDGDKKVTLLPGVPVEAKRIEGGSAEKTLTDAYGSFTFERLPGGEYELILGLPANLSAAYTDSGVVREGQTPSISIDSRDPNNASCHVRIIIEPSGSISGVVQSSGGLPIDGWVNADTVTPDDKPWNTVLTAVPESDGKFYLSHLKPGRYSVQFTSRAGFVRGKPQIIELKDGERRAGVVLMPQ